MNLADYEYQARAPVETGIQTESTGICSFTKNSASNSVWATARTTPTSNYQGVFLTRCGFGDGTTKLEIWLRHKTSGYVFTSASYSEVMREPEHRANNKVTYTFANPLVEGGNSLSNAKLKMFEDSDVAGANAWNNSSANISFSRTPVANSYDVVVKGYSTIDRCDNATAVACVNSDDRIANPVYPHMDKQTLYFENPPRNPTTNYQWTKFPNRSGKTAPNGETYLYMPAFMMHEFGHTAGLGHNWATHKIMSHTVQFNVIRLTSDDEGAMKSLYNNNHHATN